MLIHMTVNVSHDLLEALGLLASAQGRGLDEIVEDASRSYLIEASITDVTSVDVGETQMKLLSELTELPAYDDSEE
jgi:hypothetical protein